jgi:hypothetical protein
LPGKPHAPLQGTVTCAEGGLFSAAMPRYRTGTVGRHYSRHNRSGKALSQSHLAFVGPPAGARRGRTRPASPLLPSRDADHILKAAWTNPSTIIWCAPIRVIPG